MVALPAVQAARPLSGAFRFGARRRADERDGRHVTPCTESGRGLNDEAGVLEGQARIARVEPGGVAVAEIAEEVGANGRAGKEGLVDHLVIEPGHRPAVEAEGAGGENKVPSLQTAVSERRRPDELVVADE